MKSTDEMTLNELLDAGYRLDNNIIKAIYGNPTIRDLPTFASHYGLYSTFVVGQEKVFFAYGFNKDVVFGKFLEYDGDAYPKKLVEKCGYIDIQCGSDLLSFDCRTIDLKSAPKNLDCLFKEMRILEFLKQRYLHYQMEVPSYICCDSGSLSDIGMIASYLENPSVKRDRKYAEYIQRERQLLAAIACYEYPISQYNTKKPGFIAYDVYSRYSSPYDSYEQALLNYQNKQSWDSLIYRPKATADWGVVTGEPDEIEFYRREFKARHIPFKELTSETKKNMRQLSREASRLNRAIGNEADNNKETGIIVSSLDYVLIPYLHTQYTRTKFTDNILDYGKKLFERLDCDDAAVFVFSIAPELLDRFQVCAKDEGIRYGYIDDTQAGWLNSACESGFWLIAEGSECQRITDIMLELRMFESTQHDITIDHAAYWEQRFYDKDALSVCVIGHPYSNMANKTVNVKSIDSKTGKVSNIKMKAMSSDQVSYYPKEALIKSGLLVDRPDKRSVSDRQFSSQERAKRKS